MILIPVGHDHGELRRWPIITFAIMGLCAAVSFVQYDTERGRDAAARKALQEAVEYYATNPDLQPSPELKPVFERVLMAQDSSTRRLFHKDAEKKAGDEETRAERQQKLDQLTQAWQAPLRSSIVWSWGLIPSQFSWLKLVTSMFVHIGFLHLLFNMLFLYMTGPFIEDVWGRALFAVFYLAGGMFADGMFAWQDPDLDVPLVGASGAVAAVMGAFLVRYPRAKIKLLTFVLWRRVVFSAPAWLLFSLWFLGEYAEASATSSHLWAGKPAVQVANWAHVWGFVLGAAVSALIRSLRLEERYFFDAIESRRVEALDPFQSRLAQLLDRGNENEACRMVAVELLQRPNDADLAETYWRLSRTGAMKTKPAVCLRIIDNDLQQRREDLALDRWFELRGAVPAVAPDVRLGVRLARCLMEHGRRGDAEALLAECHRRLTPSSPPQDWADLAQFCVDAGLPLAAQLVPQALANPRLPTGARAALEQSTRLQGGLSLKQAG